MQADQVTESRSQCLQKEVKNESLEKQVRLQLQVIQVICILPEWIP